MPDLVSLSKSYQELLGRLKSQIRTAQVRAAASVNRELVMLYWSIGNEILIRQTKEGWGAKIIDQLSKDLRNPSQACKDFRPETSSTCAR